MQIAAHEYSLTIIDSAQRRPQLFSVVNQPVCVCVFFIPFSVSPMILRDWSNFLDIMATSVLIHHDDMVPSGDNHGSLKANGSHSAGEVTWTRPTDGAFGARQEIHGNSTAQAVHIHEIFNSQHGTVIPDLTDPMADPQGLQIRILREFFLRSPAACAGATS